MELQEFFSNVVQGGLVGFGYREFRRSFRQFQGLRTTSSECQRSFRGISRHFRQIWGFHATSGGFAEDSRSFCGFRKVSVGSRGFMGIHGGL